MLARRAPGVLRFLQLPCRWQTGGSRSNEDDTSFLTAEDFQKEGGVPASQNPEDVLLNPKTPPDLSWHHYRRLKGIDFSDRATLHANRQKEQHDQWQAELDAMRKATEAGYSTSAQDMKRIEGHTLQERSAQVEIQLDQMNATTTEGLAAELQGEPMERVDVPMQDYFNPTLFPEALDAGKWLPKRVKGRCIFCMKDPTEKHVKDIQFTNVQLLHAFINERGMITSRRWNFNCRKHQKKLAKAIRRARVLGFLSPTDNFFAPESFASTDLGDLAKLSDSTNLDFYGIGGTTRGLGHRPSTDGSRASNLPETPNEFGGEQLSAGRGKKPLSDVLEQSGP